MKKDRSEIMQDLEARLLDFTDITNLTPGSIARTFLEVLTEEFFEFYNELELTVAMGFVSTASGRYLDMIGTLLDCHRTAGELDDDFRARITNQVYVVAGANLTAIRLKALQVPGVRDVIFKEYTHGAGSFTCYVLTESLQSTPSVVQTVQNVVNDTKAFGVYAEVKSPVLIPVDVRVRLIFSSDTGAAERSTLRQSVVGAVREYINGLAVGESLIINELIQRVMEVSHKIVDMDIYGLSINQTSRYIANATVKWDEKFVLDSLDIA